MCVIILVRRVLVLIHLYRVKSRTLFARFLRRQLLLQFGTVLLCAAHGIIRAPLGPDAAIEGAVRVMLFIVFVTHLDLALAEILLLVRAEGEWFRERTYLEVDVEDKDLGSFWHRKQGRHLGLWRSDVVGVWRYGRFVEMW